MKILFQIRGDYSRNIAGDSIQMLKTKEYLEKLGVKVDISSSSRISLKNYDIIHIFNIIRAYEPYEFSQNAIEQGKPYVLSTIYWSMMDYIREAKNTTVTLEWWQRPNDLRKKLIVNAAMLLPNSETEMYMIKKDFGVETQYLVVPNCCDKFFYTAKPDEFIKKYGIQDFVLCVGRIEYRKNQLYLIEALKNTGIKLVLIGPKSDPDYYKMCAAAGDNVIFLDEFKHYELASAYAAAKVHVLPSWYETPGLSSLEAGLAGCNVITTERGTTREYFENYVEYCNPASVESINKSVMAAYNKPKGESLKIHILNNYTWEKAVKKTLEAYRKVLDFDTR